MNLSSILVYSPPASMDSVNAMLTTLPGIEVHYQCPETGRMVVIQELPDSASETEGLNRIKTLPHVLAAELVYHYLDELADGQDAPDSGSSSTGSMSGPATGEVMS